MRHAAKARAALAMTLVDLSAAGLFIGPDPDPCREAYLQSGLSQQRVGFEEFRRSYSETLCAPDGGGLPATRGDRAPGASR
jgi:hypothetical protein